MSKGHHPAHGTVTRRGRNSFWLRYPGPKDPLTGKRQRLTETVNVASEADAWNELKKRQAAILTGEFAAPVRLSLAAYLEEWFPTYKASPKTRERAKGFIDCQIVPFIGNLRLQTLDKATLAAWHTALAERGHRRGGPLAPQTVHNCHLVLRRALRDAVPRLLPRNPAADMPTPAVPHKPQTILARPEARPVLDGLAGHAYLQPVAALAIGGGLRIGEIIALTWGDVDFATGRINIDKAIGHTRQEGPYLKGPKTAAGYRNVEIDPLFLAYLAAHCEKLAAARRTAGLPPPAAADRLFTRPDGTMLDSAKVSRDFANARCCRGLPPAAHLHGLRHLHASILLHARYDLPRLARRLGHGSPDITLRVYAHALPQEPDPAAALVGAAFGSCLGGGGTPHRLAGADCTPPNRVHGRLADPLTGTSQVDQKVDQLA
jgi:integrase